MQVQRLPRFKTPRNWVYATCGFPNMWKASLSPKPVVFYFSPHLCVGFLFLVVHPRPLLLPPPASSCLHLLPLTHNLLTHKSHTTLSHTRRTHSQHNLLTHNSLTHNSLTHNSLTRNLLTHTSHTQLPHTQLVHTQLSHTKLPHTQLPHTQLSHPHNSFTHSLPTHNSFTDNLLAGVTLGDIDFHFVWQAWHLATATCILHGRHGTWLTATFILRGRRGTWRHRRAFCVAGVAIDLHFVEQAWHLSHWAGSGGALGSRVSPWTVTPDLLRGRRGTW